MKTIDIKNDLEEFENNLKENRVILKEKLNNLNKINKGLSIFNKDLEEKIAKNLTYHLKNSKKKKDLKIEKFINLF